MALFIDFKSGVDEYYRNQAKDSPWSSILSSLEKGYTKANYDLNKQAQQNNALAVQSGQKAVTDLYTSYLQNRKSIEGAGFSSTFASQSKKALGADVGAMGKGVYQQAVAQGSTQAQGLNIEENEMMKAYRKQTEGVGKTWENVLSYFNTGDGGMSDYDYAQSQGLMADGQLTAKGKAYLKYYMGQQGTVEGDTYTGSKGTLQQYLKTNVDGINQDWVKTLGAMSGVDLDTVSYTDEERRAITGLTTENTVTSINTTEWETPAKVADSKGDPWGWFAQNVLGINKTEKDPRQSASVGWSNYNGNKTYILNDKMTDGMIKQFSKTKQLDLTLNGLSLDEAIKFGVLKDGDVFEKEGLRFIVNGGKFRLFMTDSEITKAYNENWQQK